MVSVGLFAVALSPVGWLMYPVVGVVAVGFGAAIPAVASLVSRRVPSGGQGRLMGGQQAILSLTLVVGPPFAGLVFDGIGAGAPYIAGGVLALSAFAVATFRLRGG